MKKPMTIARELIEERAAIVQEGCKCSRHVAQYTVARDRGFASWGDLVRAANRASE